MISAASAQTSEPAFWEIVGVGGVLRSVPVDGGGVVDRPDPGAIVKNLGCRQSRGRRWCEVELVDRPGVSGWIGNNNLRVAMPKSPPLAGPPAGAGDTASGGFGPGGPGPAPDAPPAGAFEGLPSGGGADGSALGEDTDAPGAIRPGP